MKSLAVLTSIVTLSLVFLLFTPNISQATTYHVDKNHSSGSDANPGTKDLPWLTIQHAADTMVAGDTVLIRNGVYNEHIHTQHNGNDTAGHIVFSAYPGETPILDGTGVTESQNGIIVDNSYIKLIGLEIRNWNDNAIWTEGAGYLEISDCKVHDVAYGIGVAEGTHDFVFNRVEAHHFDYYGFDASPDGVDCYNGTFNDCVAHTGRDSTQNVDGFAIGHGNQHDFVFNRCETYEVYDGFDIGEGSVNVTLNRSSAHKCWNGGYKLWGDNVTLVNCLGYNSGTNVELDWAHEAPNPGTTTLRNCTFVDARIYNIWIENSADSLHMYNTILAGGDNIGLAFEQMGVKNYRGDYNVFHNDNPDRAIAVGYEDEFSLNQVAAGEWTTYSGQDAHSIVAFSAADLFVDPANFDLHLLKTSPAIDKGTSVGAPSEDYDGNPRPIGQKYDIGAYEYADFPGPIVTTGSATAVNSTAATLNGTVNPRGASTTVVFEWGLEDSYGNEITATQSPLTGTTAQAVSAGLIGLAPAETYHFRAKANSSGGTSYGSDVTFTTSYPSFIYVSQDGTCGGKNPCYTSIQAAINAAGTGAVIRIAQGTYSESITLNTSKSLTLQGGWNYPFTSQTPNTTFIKAPKATQGSITVQEAVIKP